MNTSFEGVLEAINSRVDGTIKVSLGTQELNANEIGQLFHFRGKFLKVLFSDNNIEPAEEFVLIEQKTMDGKKVKSQSQRLRAVLFRVFEMEKGPGEIDKNEFDNFYKIQMEILIDHFKKKLE